MINMIFIIDNALSHPILYSSPYATMKKAKKPAIASIKHAI